jgi:hypothetical protein
MSWKAKHGRMLRICVEIIAHECVAMYCSTSLNMEVKLHISHECVDNLKSNFTSLKMEDTGNFSSMLKYNQQ